MEFDQFDTNSLMYITNRPEIVFIKGEGMWLTDNTGKRYVDYLQGWAVNTFGHSPKLIQDAVISQVKTLINPSPAFYNAPMIELASLLTHNSTFDRVFFANSGGEANEGAIKLARKWGQKNPNANGEARYEIITFDHSFHGRTIATMSASGKEGWDKKFAPQVPGFPKADLNDLDSVKKLVNDRTVAVMLEPVQGEGGVIPADPAFLKALREFTQENNLLLIVDEVQTGMGRTGKLFAHQWAGIAPDIMTLAKGIGGGVPLAALLATESVSVFEAGDQGGTFNGNPLCSAVGVAIVKHLLEPGVLAHIQEMGNYLSQQLTELSQRFGLGAERGEGLLRALELGSDIGNQIVEVSRELEPIGLLVNAPRAHLLRFMPALNVTKEEIDTLITMLSEVLTKIKK